MSWYFARLMIGMSGIVHRYHRYQSKWWIANCAALTPHSIISSFDGPLVTSKTPGGSIACFSTAKAWKNVLVWTTGLTFWKKKVPYSCGADYTVGHSTPPPLRYKMGKPKRNRLHYFSELKTGAILPSID